jgi:hypothetical protein
MTINSKDLKSIGFIIKQEALHSTPRNAEELYKAIQVLFNVSVPYTACSENTVAPYQWIHDIFFERENKTMAIGGRGTSKTFGASKLHYLQNTFYPNFETLHASATRAQALICQRYLQQFTNDPNLKSVLTDEPSKTEAKWKNGSFWKIATGSFTGVSGFHPVAAYYDELESWKIEDIEQTWGNPVPKNGHKAGWHGFSTVQRSFGCANWLANEAQDKGIRVYTWTIFETLKPCTTCHALDTHPHGSEDQRQLVCNLWEDCLGVRAKKSTGWVELSHAQELKRSMTLQSWRTQGLCEKPSTTGLVLFNFEHSYRLQGGNLTAYTYRPDLPLYCCHDPAESKESAFYFMQILEDCIYVFDELIQNPCPNTSHTKKAVYQYCQEKNYSDPVVIIVDPRKTDAIADWKEGSVNGTGLGRSYNAIPSPMDNASGGQVISAGIDLLRKHIEDGDRTRKLFVNPKQCPKLIVGIKEYHYPVNGNNEVISDTPSKEYSDRIDPLRYFVQWYKYRYVSFKNTAIKLI